jgi:hypothetical protein
VTQILRDRRHLDADRDAATMQDMQIALTGLQHRATLDGNHERVDRHHHIHVCFVMTFPAALIFGYHESIRSQPVDELILYRAPPARLGWRVADRRKPPTISSRPVPGSQKIAQLQLIETRPPFMRAADIRSSTKTKRSAAAHLHLSFASGKRFNYVRAILASTIIGIHR